MKRPSPLLTSDGCCRLVQLVSLQILFSADRRLCGIAFFVICGELRFQRRETVGEFLVRRTVRARAPPSVLAAGRRRGCMMLCLGKAGIAGRTKKRTTATPAIKFYFPCMRPPFEMFMARDRRTCHAPPPGAWFAAPCKGDMTVQ